MMLIGLALAVASALGTNIAFLLKHRGAVQAPPVEGAHPLHSAAGLFHSRWFVWGWTVAVIAWFFHSGALALAPLSLVQAVLAAGLVFLGLLGERYFGLSVGVRQWVGIGVTTVALIIIALTNGHIGRYHYALAALIAVESSVFLASAVLAAASMHGRWTKRTKGILLGLASGALFGVSDIALKYLSHALQHGPLAIVSPWTLAALLAGLISFFTSARSLQLGKAVEVIALTAVAANLVAILGGILVFRDPIGRGVVSIVFRVIAFCLVVVGAALVPGPSRVHQHRHHST